MGVLTGQVWTRKGDLSAHLSLPWYLLMMFEKVVFCLPPWTTAMEFA